MKSTLMIASLMMYTRPELTAAHNRYWALIRKHLTEAGITSPETLAQNAGEFFVWRHPELVVSQTCGMPYRLWLSEQVQLVGTPDFGVEGCPPGYYRSAIVVRTDDSRTTLDAFKDSIFAYNQTFSQSGYAAPYSHLKPRGFWFQNRCPTGGHLQSALAVAENNADIAALDAVTWRLISRYEDFAELLRVLEWTEPTPGLPLITAKDRDADMIFDAVERAIQALTDQDRLDLGLRSIVRIPASAYLAIENPDAEDYPTTVS